MQEKPLKVLLVEDNPTDALLVEIAFEETSSGAELTHVMRASQAVEELQKQEFDIVLLDLGLPDSRGLETFATLHRLAPRTPIIALTGLSDEKLALEALQSGASDYLIKGQTPAALLERATRYAIERKRTENQRLELVREQAARQEAEANNRAKDEFLATLSHELRTPLNAIMGWASLMRGGALSPEMTLQAIETIERNARTQARLIEDLLDVSRIITGNLRLNMASIEPRELIESVADGLRPAINEKNLHLHLKMQNVAAICGDTVRLQQVVGNLMSNAIKFTSEGGDITVQLSQIAAFKNDDISLPTMSGAGVSSDRLGHETEENNSGEWVLLSIKDSGQGIAPEFLPHVFDRFRQADGSTTRRHGGLGLGLAIVRNLVQLHKGSVEVESDGLGLGATFRLRLPALQKLAELEREQPSSSDPDLPAVGFAPDPDANALTLNGIKILGIDDQSDARNLVQTMLSAHGAEVQMADCATTAIELLQSWQPAIIVSDVGMPEIDGYELMRRIRALPVADGGITPAIALTGYARSEERNRALAAGFQAFLAKPVQPHDLVSVITRLTKRS